MAGNYARAIWTLIEPIHAVTYFTPEARAAFADAGLRGFWRGYFAGRCAPLGAVDPAPVVALFNGFAPGMVTRALPEVWTLAAPPAVLRAREDGAVAALRRMLAGADPQAVDAAAQALREAVTRLPLPGRALGAANAALPVPADPYAALWWAATVLREHRGDGHVAALVASGIAGIDALILRCGADLARASLQPARGWTDEQWTAAADRLRARHLLDADDRVTAEGSGVLGMAEAVTDFAAGAPWTDPAQAVATGLLLAPLARACAEALPTPNPIGTWTLWDPQADPAAESP